MEKTTFVASCPVCGRSLFKGSPSSYIEGGCPKCGEYLKIVFSETGYSILVNRSKGETTKKNQIKTE